MRQFHELHGERDFLYAALMPDYLDLPKVWSSQSPGPQQYLKCWPFGQFCRFWVYTMAYSIWYILWYTVCGIYYGI